MLRIPLFALAAWLLAQAGATTAPRDVTLAALTVRQQVLPGNSGTYHAGDTFNVEFSLARSAPVTIGVYADLPLGTGERWYASPATQVLAVKMKRCEAGRSSITIRLGELHPPAAPLPGTPEHPAPALPKAGDPGTLPGRYVVEVSDGKTLLHVTAQLLPAGAPVPASRAVPYFMGAARDSHGNLLVADRGAWRGRRYSDAWRLEETYPKASLGQSSDPVECYDAAVDSHDNLYLMTISGAYRFGPDGNPLAWASDDDFLKCPYPSEVKNHLGVRLDPAATGKKRYVFGPGGGGAGSKEYDSKEALKNPGFAFLWGGLAIDAQDNLYLGRLVPQPQIQVFAPTGKFLRAIPVPAGVSVRVLRFDKKGGLWAGGEGPLHRLNATTGADEKATNIPARALHVAPDGTLFAFDGACIWRLSPAGEPVPFTAKGPCVRDGGKYLDLRPRDSNLPEDAPGCTNAITGVAAGPKGDFFVSSQDNRLLHFAADGAFLPDTPALAVQPYETGNVFLAAEPAAVGVQITNLSPQETDVELSARVHDLDGRELGRHAETLSVAPLSLAASTFSLGDDVAEYGYYTIDVEAKAGETVLAATRLFGGRVAAREGAFPPYSPFGAVRMEGNPELMRRAGGGLNRNHNPVYWDSVESPRGIFRLQPANALDFYRERRMPAMVILGYGEPWYQGGFPKCRITSYDDFFVYVARVIGRHRGTAAIWQFWNEPNYFWHVPGPYRYEQYAEVLEGVYSIAKALDPDTPVICDGFAGEAKGMADLAGQGAAGFTDAVPIHYPGARTLSFDNMPLQGTVESKAGMVKDLAYVRDRNYPGRPLFNTEEGLWGLAGRTPRSGAELLPRIYVTQLAAGLDRLTWFETFSKDDPTYLLRGVNDGPWPAYFAYATAGRFLENAQYVGALSDGLAQAHLFAVAGRPLIVAWSMEGERPLVLDVGTNQVSVTDWQGNTLAVPTPAGKLPIKLGPAVQYIAGADARLFGPVVERRLEAARKDPDLARALAAAWATANGPLDLNTLYQKARWAELLPFLPGGVEPNIGLVSKANEALASAEKALRAREKGGAYLRDTRTALEIARRMAYFMNLAAGAGSSQYAQQLAHSVGLAAAQVSAYARTEKPWYPGVMLRAALDTTAIRQKTPAGEPLDERFDPQVSKRAGDSVELEMTLYNWTGAALQGSLSPVLPAGWAAKETRFDYRVAPMQLARFTTVVSIPANAAPGIYPLGVQTQYRGTVQRELHAQRVQVGGK